MVQEPNTQDLSTSDSKGDQAENGHANASEPHEDSEHKNTPFDQNGDRMDEDKEKHASSEERVVWIRCDVYDTGIGIPGNFLLSTFVFLSLFSMNVSAKYVIVLVKFDVTDHAIPTLFKKYMQVGADTARKYGGTGLGLAICKQLVIPISI